MKHKPFGGFKKGELYYILANGSRPTVAEWKATSLFDQRMAAGKLCSESPAIHHGIKTLGWNDNAAFDEYIDGLSLRCWKFRYDGRLSESANVTKHAVQPRTPYSMPEFTMNCPALSSLIPATHLTFTSFDCFLKTYYDMQSLPNSEIHAINELGGITLYPVVKNNQEAIAYEGLISFFNEQQEIAVKELAEWQALNDESIACDNNCNELTRSYLITKSERAAAYQLAEAARKRVNEYKRSKLPLLRLKCAVCVESIDAARADFNKVELQDSLDDLVREKRLNVLNGDGKWQWQWPGLEFLNEEFEHTRLSASLGLPLSGRFAPKYSTANKTASKRRSTKK